jgi:hypothetical protein
VLPGIDGRHCRSNHDHEAKDAKERIDRDTCNEEPETNEESHARERRATPMYPSDAGPPQSIDQLRILGRQCGFHLLEKPLLLI